MELAPTTSTIIYSIPQKEKSILIYPNREIYHEIFKRSISTDSIQPESSISRAGSFDSELSVQIYPYASWSRQLRRSMDNFCDMDLVNSCDDLVNLCLEESNDAAYSYRKISNYKILQLLNHVEMYNPEKYTCC